MQTFRKKYIYNPENPIFESENVRTFNCMNTQTKDKKLIIIQHLKEPPFVQPSSGILQPVEIPTTIQPFSVYPIVRCVSQIGKTSEPEAMYVIKCLLESKLKKPMYNVISTQGVVCSDVQGILPNRSPELFQLAIDMLDIPANLQQVQKSVVSKQGYSICRALRNGQSPLNSIQNYGWKDIKKDKEQVYDDQFIVFKGRRKQEGPFGEQYGLAWHNQHGLSKMKFINLIKDGYEQQFYKQFSEVINYIQQNTKDKNNSTFLKIFKYSKDTKGIKIFIEIANQGTLSDYIAKKHELGQTLNQKNITALLDLFVKNMKNISAQLNKKGFGTLHIKSLNVHNNILCIGQPLFITDKTQKKLRELKNSMDYYAPELKQNIILPENLMKLDRQKMDIWSFGFIIHKIIMRQIPIFDSSKKPLIAKDKFSLGIFQLVNQCLDLNPNNRPTWNLINIKEATQRFTIVQQVKQQQRIQREEIRLDSRSSRRKERVKSPQKKSIISQQQSRKQRQRLEQQKQKKIKQIQSQNAKLKQQQQQEQLQFIIPVPTQISSRLKKIKLSIKIIAIMLLYIFVFFRVFFGNSTNILQVRNLYTTASLRLVDYSNNRLSTFTVITHDPLFFLKNDITFADIQQQYHCIDNYFDPVYNPDYSLLPYIHSSQFLSLLLLGWFAAVAICTVKAISIWKGGISNRPLKRQGRYWFIYIFHELTLASLLFAHFYIFQFFYFSGASPCLSIQNFTGVQPFFDSSLFLFLQHTEGYFRQVFSTLGVLSIFLILSSCFYAWGPKLDQKYFISVPSIVLRVVPFVLLLLICRIGVFMIFSPTALNDTTKILPAIITNSFQGFIGIIPQIFILITLIVQILIQLFMFWCEKKAAQSDQLSKLFNIRDKKVSVGNNDQSIIHDMSMVNNSKHKLDISSMQQL